MWVTPECYKNAGSPFCNFRLIEVIASQVFQNPSRIYELKPKYPSLGRILSCRTSENLIKGTIGEAVMMSDVSDPNQAGPCLVGATERFLPVTAHNRIIQFDLQQLHLQLHIRPQSELNALSWYRLRRY